MEMCPGKEKNVLSIVFHYIGHVAGRFYAIARSILKPGDVRVKTEAERQAEYRKQCYEAQAMAATWQCTRYFR